MHLWDFTDAFTENKKQHRSTSYKRNAHSPLRQYSTKEGIKSVESKEVCHLFVWHGRHQSNQDKLCAPCAYIRRTNQRVRSAQLYTYIIYVIRVISLASLISSMVTIISILTNRILARFSIVDETKTTLVRHARPSRINFRQLIFGATFVTDRQIKEVNNKMARVYLRVSLDVGSRIGSILECILTSIQMTVAIWLSIHIY